MDQASAKLRIWHPHSWPFQLHAALVPVSVFLVKVLFPPDNICVMLLEKNGFLCLLMLNTIDQFIFQFFQSFRLAHTLLLVWLSILNDTFMWECGCVCLCASASVCMCVFAHPILINHSTSILRTFWLALILELALGFGDGNSCGQGISWGG